MADIRYVEHIHYDKEREKAILGACLLERNAFGLIRGKVEKDCFYVSAHQTVFEVIDDLWKRDRVIDIIEVTSEVVRNKISLAPGEFPGHFITQLTNAVVSSAHIEAHAIGLRQMWCERRLLEIRNSPDKGKDTVTKIHNLQMELDYLLNMRANYDWTDMPTNVMNLMKHMEAVKDREFIGTTLGFRGLDLMTGGSVPGSLTVVGARPSVGKTAFMNGCVLHQAAGGIPVGIISLETPKVQVTARMGSIVTGQPFFKIYRNQMMDENERKAVYQSLSALSELPIFISDKVGVNVYDIKAKVAQLIYKHQLGSLWLDYLQLVEGDESNKNFNREQIVARISRALKVLAMDFGIPIYLLVQLNRETEKNAGKKPELHNIRESGAIEQDADGVMFLHRDWKVGITEDENRNTTEREADIIVAKWRNGETRSFKVGFDAEKMRFVDPYVEPNFLRQYELPAERNIWTPIND